jgi:hypothetical protein
MLFQIHSSGDCDGDVTLWLHGCSDMPTNRCTGCGQGHVMKTDGDQIMKQTDSSQNWGQNRAADRSVKRSID